MPARSTLAARMRKESTDTVDRAMRELVELGTVVVENRFDRGQRLTNKYLVRTTRPRPDDASGGRGGRISAARVAANLRQKPKSFTHSSTAPPPPTVAPRATEPAPRFCGRRRRSDSAANAGSATGTASSPNASRFAANSVMGGCAQRLTDLVTRRRPWSARP